jgi:hypothetical protein
VVIRVTESICSTSEALTIHYYFTCHLLHGLSSSRYLPKKILYERLLIHNLAARPALCTDPDITDLTELGNLYKPQSSSFRILMAWDPEYDVIKHVKFVSLIIVHVYLWLHSRFFGPWPIFSFLILYTVCRTPWTGDQSVASPLPTHRKNAHTDTHSLNGIRTHDSSVRACEDHAAAVIDTRGIHVSNCSRIPRETTPSARKF